jgi:ABC-type proline/glycine betaine transport system permease subunit
VTVIVVVFAGIAAASGLGSLVFSLATHKKVDKVLKNGLNNHTGE